LTDTSLPESHSLEAVSPSLNLGAMAALRSTWLGPAWAVLCGIVASAAFTLDAQNLLMAALVFIVADWAWPALWTTSVRTDWRAPLAHWPALPAPTHSLWLPYLQPDSPGDRMLAWLARLRVWWRSIFSPLAGMSLASIVAALSIGLVLSTAIGWRALALTSAVVALTGMGSLRGLRTGLDPDGLRALVYGVLPWWLGHAAFAPLTAESAVLGVLFGAAYGSLMASDAYGPSRFGLIAPQLIAAGALFVGGQPAAAFVIALTIVAQAALRSFLADHAFARRAQIWLMVAMLACAIALA